MYGLCGKIVLKPILKLNEEAWIRIHRHFSDKEISYLNGTKPNRIPRWLFKCILKTDAKQRDRKTFGIIANDTIKEEYIGLIELYNLTSKTAIIGIVIGERNYWNKGYGTDAISTMLNYAFTELNLEAVRLNTFADNMRALKSFSKVGFTEFKRVKTRKGREKVFMEIDFTTWQKSIIERPIDKATSTCTQLK